jgi:hypothetical protein
MLTKEQILIIINKKEPNNQEIISILRQYILDVKKEDTSKIDIVEPTYPMQTNLMYYMYNVAKNYYYANK